MDSVPQARRRVTVGVDTHGDVHVGAVVDELGRILGTVEVAADPAGYLQLLRFAERLGCIDRFGVEGTGAYGAGLSRWLADRGHTVIEVDRPDRKTRRAQGKSDPIDACSAARQTLSGIASAIPKTRDGRGEMIRVLRVARRSAIRARTQAQNQIHALITSGPEELRAGLRGLSASELVRTAAGLRPGEITTPAAATKLALRELGRRHRDLTAEVARLDAELTRLVREAAPGLLELRGRHRRRRRALGHGWRQPSAASQRVFFRAPLRGGSDPGLLGQDHPPPAQPRRGSTGQPGSLAHRDGEDELR